MMYIDVLDCVSMFCKLFRALCLELWPHRFPASNELRYGQHDNEWMSEAKTI